jgi:hypothetical protein
MTNRLAFASMLAAEPDADAGEAAGLTDYL